MIGALLSACHTSRERADRVLRIAVDTHDIVLQLPVYVAVNQGLFRAHHARVELAEYPSASATAEAVASGACEIGAGGFDQVLLAGDKGAALEAFVLMSRSPMLSLVGPVRPRKRHQSASDLRGERIAVERSGDATDLFARYVLRQAGLTMDEIETEPKGSRAAAVDAFVHQDDAAAVVDPIGLRALDRGSPPYVLLADTRTLAGLLQTYGVSTYPASCLYARVAFADQNRSGTKQVAKAIVAALEFIGQHEAAQLAPMLPETYTRQITAPDLQAVIEQARPLFSRDGVFSADGVRAVHKVLGRPSSASEPYTNQALK